MKNDDSLGKSNFFAMGFPKGWPSEHEQDPQDNEDFCKASHDAPLSLWRFPKSSFLQRTQYEVWLRVPKFLLFPTVDDFIEIINPLMNYLRIHLQYKLKQKKHIRQQNMKSFI
jgi:hypothetical protein